jgi:hypothetical protein
MAAKALDRLHEVGDEFRILFSCQKHMAETGESGLHSQVTSSMQQADFR